VHKCNSSGDMIKVLADALVPIFAGLLFGYIAGRRRVMDNQNVHNLIVFVMSFAVPCSLFLAIARTPRAALREQAGTLLVLLIAYSVLYALSFFWARSAEKLRASDSGVLALTISFPNIAAIGLPLLADVFGVKSLVTVATSIALGSVTISVVTLAFLEADRSGSGDAFSFRQAGPSLVRTVKKPIVWAPVLGFVFSCAVWHLPSYLDRFLTVLASAAAGSALVLTGLVVSAQKFVLGAKTLIPVLLKNALQPALALGLALLLHLSMDQTRYVTLICAIPCGFFGLVFGKAFGSSPQLASSGLIASYIVSVATLPVWIVIVNHLG
jgi:malonate transporter and related proteins